MKVRDIMTDIAVSVSPSTVVMEAAHMMKVHGITLIPVCSMGKFRGVITAEDIVTRLVANGTDPVCASAILVMNSNYPRISPDADITEAARIMVNDNIYNLPVVQDSKLFGLVALYDVIVNGMLLDA